MDNRKSKHLLLYVDITLTPSRHINTPFFSYSKEPTTFIDMQLLDITLKREISVKNKLKLSKLGYCTPNKSLEKYYRVGIRTNPPNPQSAKQLKLIFSTQKVSTLGV